MLSAVAGKTLSHDLKMLNIRIDDSIPQPDAYIEKPTKAEELLKLTRTLIET
jgi:hypothetical protein